MDLQALMQAQAGLAAGQEAKPLLEFRAGIMELKDHTLTADPRRGRVIITSDDSLGAPMLKLQWQIRPNNNTDFQLLLMEKSATLTKVEGCKDGRVVQLKLDGGARRFFWMQEPKAEGDADILKKFDEIITKIPQRDPNEALAARLAMSDEDIPAEAFQQQFLSPTHSTATGQAPSGPVATIPPAATPAGTAGAPPAGVSADAMAAFTQLAQAFAARQGGAGAGAGGIPAATAALLQQQQRAQYEQQQQHSLNEVLDADRIQPLLQSDDAAVESLLQHLPDGHRTRAELWATLRSPQMHQTVGRINQILNSSQFGQLMASFSLPLGTNIGVPGFIEAIQRTVGNTPTSTSTSSSSTSSSTSSNTDSSTADKPADSK